MIKLRDYIVLFFVLLFFSCSRREDKQMSLLLRADSLIQVNHADSALNVLRNIPFEGLETSASRAKYALLMTQAKDKNYILHTNDSLIRIAVGYYDSTNDILSQAKAHYYLGRIHQDMNNVTGTVREFLTAMPLAEKVRDYNLICLLQNNLGYLFWEHKLLSEADSLYRCAGRLAEEHQDSLRWALSLSKLGDISIEKGNKYYVEAEGYFKRALLIVKRTKGSINIERDIVSSLGHLYELMEKYSEAICFVRRKIVLQPDTTKLYSDYLFLGSIYFKEEKYDSAEVYLTKCLSCNAYAIKAGVYMRLADIAEKCGNEKEALRLGKYYEAYKDSARLEVRPVEIVSSLKDILYEQSVVRYESFLNRYLLYILILVLTLLISGVFFYNKHKQEKSKTKELLERQAFINLLSEQLKQLLQHKECEIEDLRKRYIESEGNRHKQMQINSCLSELLEQKITIFADMEEVLKQKDGMIEILSKKKFKDFIEETSIFQKLLALKKENARNPDKMNKPDENDWKELILEINRHSFDFTVRLVGKYELLLEDDIRFCCLVKLGFKFSEMSSILACTLDTIYKREKTILHRMQVESKIRIKELINEI